MSETSIIARKRGRAGRITLNRPKALHALNMDMVQLMTERLLAWAKDPEVELIIIDHAPGSRGFCAGGDVRMLARSGNLDGREAAAFFRAEYQLNELLHAYAKPVVSILDGITMGGGAGISIHGSHRIATENTVFAMPEVGIGLFPDVGGTWFLPRLPSKLGFWLALTGERLNSEDVLAAGLATHYCNQNQIPSLVHNLIELGTAALWAQKPAVAFSMTDHLDEMKICFARDTPRAVLKALKEGSDWARCQVTKLEAKSPLSIAITFRQLKTGEFLSTFREALRLEYRIAIRLVGTRNFQEGVRAAVIEKDHKPNWKPAHIRDVRSDDIARFFNPLRDGELDFLEIKA